MEGLLLGGSLLAAFLAGSIALFAPCCILVVFPAYLAAGVRNARWRLVPLTLVFAAGLAVVLVPVSLGLALLSRTLLAFHSTVYALGGVLLLALAVVAFTGRTWTLPFLRGAPDIQRTDSAGVFALGVFSGAASSCCAPVLAGVLTLTAVSPSLLGGTGIALAYVFGMVFPLLLMTLVWDRSSLRKRFTLRSRPVEVGFAGRRYATNTLNLVMAGIFAVMGAVLIGIGISGRSIAPTFQTGFGARIEDLLAPIARLVDPVPDWAGGLVLITLGVGAAALSARSRRPDDLDDLDDSDGLDDHTHDPVPVATAADPHTPRGDTDRGDTHCH